MISNFSFGIITSSLFCCIIIALITYIGKGFKLWPTIYRCSSGRHSEDIRWYKGRKHSIYNKKYKFWKVKHVWGPIYKTVDFYGWVLCSEFIEEQSLKAPRRRFWK